LYAILTFFPGFGASDENRIPEWGKTLNSKDFLLGFGKLLTGKRGRGESFFDTTLAIYKRKCFY
jgi:hypothetical protein